MARRTPRVGSAAVLIAALWLITSLFVGCHDSSGGGSGTAFTSFVTGLVAGTSETAEPVSLDGRAFVFSEDPNAFDSLFP